MPFYQITGRGSKSGRKRKARLYFAKNEAAAVGKAKKDGTNPDHVEVIDIWPCMTSVAGCSHKNADNTSRQKIVRKCGLGESLILEHEVGNRYDVHAVKVLRSNGEQVGYLPQAVAHNVIEGYWKGGGCNYWAISLGSEKMGDDTDLKTLRVLFVVALPTASEEGFSECVQQQLAKANLESLTGKPVVAKPLEAVERDISGNSSGAGCMVVMAAVLLIIASAFYGFVS